MLTVSNLYLSYTSLQLLAENNVMVQSNVYVDICIFSYEIAIPINIVTRRENFLLIYHLTQIIIVYLGFS